MLSGTALAAVLLAGGSLSAAPTTPEEHKQPPPGLMIERNPGVVVLCYHGLRGDDWPADVEGALSLFVTSYGAEAGNLALKVLPTGGLFVAGGMAPKLIGVLRRGEFMESMLDKGRMSGLLASMRVSVVMNARVGLLGARAEASMVYRSGPVL